MTDSLQKVPRSSWIAIAALCLGLFPLAVVTYNHLTEDAFITFRYVEQFAGGHGLVYNRGERVEGFSNPLWVAILTPFAVVGADLLVWSRVVSVAFLAGLVFFCWWTGWKVLGGGPHRWLAWWLPLAAALHPYLNYHRDTGLETVQHAAVLGGMLLAVGLRHWRGAAVLGALAGLSRPEGFGFVIALWPAAILELWSLKQDKAEDAKERRRRVLAFLIAPVAVWLVAELARRVYYDSWVANTVRAKRHNAEGLQEILPLLTTWWCFPLIGFAGAAAVWWRDRRNLLALSTCLTIAAGVAFQFKIGRIPNSGFRYLVPVMFPSLVGVWLLLAEGAMRFARTPRRVIGMQAAAALFLALSLWTPHRWHSRWLVGIPGESPDFRLPVRIGHFLARWDAGARWDWYTSEPILLNADAGRWIRDELVPEHPGAMLAADQMGMLGYYAPRETPIVDMLGLMDRHVATYNLAGRQLAEYLVERGVDFVVLQTFRDDPPEVLWPFLPEELWGRACVPTLQSTVGEPPGSVHFRPWVLLRPRFNGEGRMFVVYGPPVGAPEEPRVVTLGPGREEFLRKWRVTPVEEIPPPP